jgi:hypothetical protein
MHNDSLITAKAKADELGISRATLSRKVAAGEIVPAFQAEGKNGIMLFEPETSQSSAVAADSTENTHAGVVPRPSVSSGAEDVPPTSSALPKLERVAS